MVIAIIVYAFGSLVDIVPSIGRKELHPLFRTKNGGFNLLLNIAFTLGVFAALYFFGNQIGDFFGTENGAEKLILFTGVFRALAGLYLIIR